MRRWNRIVLLMGMIALAPVLAACENFDMDKLDVFHLNEKKKLPGDRRDLFPSGVPGVTQGIPPEYLHANQPPPESAQAAPVNQPDAATEAEPDEQAPAGVARRKTAAVGPTNIAPESEPKAKPKPKPKAKAKPKPKPQPASATAQPQQQQQPAQQAWPANDQSGGTAPWPAQPAPAGSR
jgi:cell division septation protein DedD